MCRVITKGNVVISYTNFKFYFNKIIGNKILLNSTLSKYYDLNKGFAWTRSQFNAAFDR